MSFLNNFKEDLIRHLTRSRCDLSHDLDKLLKFHKCGKFDFSFNLKMNCWKNFFTDEEKCIYEDNVLKFAQQTTDEEYLESFKARSGKYVLIFPSIFSHLIFQQLGLYLSMRLLSTTIDVISQLIGRQLTGYTWMN